MMDGDTSEYPPAIILEMHMPKGLSRLNPDKEWPAGSYSK